MLTVEKGCERVRGSITVNSKVLLECQLKCSQAVLELEGRLEGIMLHCLHGLTRLLLCSTDFAQIISLSVEGPVLRNTSFISSEPCWAKIG